MKERKLCPFAAKMINEECTLAELTKHGKECSVCQQILQAEGLDVDFPHELGNIRINKENIDYELAKLKKKTAKEKKENDELKEIYAELKKLGPNATVGDVLDKWEKQSEGT